ncbi:MAG TPA: diguanylate cyclase [Solirubrobacteraceae bacterium]|nr:diguanylate cyclase [Solirubrobacteraceae bacterium]
MISFVAVLVRDLGVESPVWSWGWDKVYNLVELLAVATVGLRAATTRGSERASWIALTLGLAGFAAGDLYWTLVLAGLDEPPYPSPADAGYLAIYPGAYVALVLLLRARAGRVSSTLWLDGLIAALSVAALGAALVFGVVASIDGSFAAVATNLGYPLGDLAMLAFVFAVMTVTGWRAGRTWALIALGFAVFAVADTIYLYQSAVGTYEENTLLDTGWPASFMILAFAAWQPPKRLDAGHLRGWGMLVVPGVLAVVPLGMLVLDHYSRINQLALWLAAATGLVVVARFALTFRENVRMLRESEFEATTDALTGLGNRRALLRDLQAAAGVDVPGHSHVLVLFDLDGFKSYNDAFGHPAGDALLERLGRNLAATLNGRGGAYRMGGDEFCVLVLVADGDSDTVIADASAALTERGERFNVGCSHGTVVLERVGDPAEALRLADQRMYANKHGGRQTREEMVHQVLLRVLGEHDGALRDHVDDVAQLAERVARRLGLDDRDVADVRRAAALHDIGKVAIPDAILHAPRALTEDEWEYMRQHTIIGARIIGAAPEMARVAEMVRSSHERWDGGGYPDGLAGAEIPLGARIVSVCDTFDAMTTMRAYRGAGPVDEALAELQRCAGSQFDPAVVDAFMAVFEARPQRPAVALA